MQGTRERVCVRTLETMGFGRHLSVTIIMTWRQSAWITISILLLSGEWQGRRGREIFQRFMVLGCLAPIPVLFVIGENPINFTFSFHQGQRITRKILLVCCSLVVLQGFLFRYLLRSWCCVPEVTRSRSTADPAPFWTCAQRKWPWTGTGSAWTGGSTCRSSHAREI